MDFITIQLSTARLLRDNKDMRAVNMREAVWLKVRQTHPGAKFSTVERSIRHIQNKLGKYKPCESDGRYETEQKYRDYYGV